MDLDLTDLIVNKNPKYAIYDLIGVVCFGIPQQMTDYYAFVKNTNSLSKIVQILNYHKFNFIVVMNV